MSYVFVATMVIKDISARSQSGEWTSFDGGIFGAGAAGTSGTAPAADYCEAAKARIDRETSLTEFFIHQNIQAASVLGSLAGPIIAELAVNPPEWAE